MFRLRDFLEASTKIRAIVLRGRLLLIDIFHPQNQIPFRTGLVSSVLAQEEWCPVPVLPVKSEERKI